MTVIRNLPATHAITGADTTSKIGTKDYMMTHKQKFSLLNGFGIAELSEEMIKSAESFLINCIDKSRSKSRTFDDLRVVCFNDYGKELDLNKLPCSSLALREHIKRALYLQTNLWLTATDAERSILHNKESYGWSYSGSILAPTLLPRPQGLLIRPANLPEPCKCGVCRFESRCRCRINKLKCCRYCACSKNNKFENPYC